MFVFLSLLIVGALSLYWLFKKLGPNDDYWHKMGIPVAKTGNLLTTFFLAKDFTFVKQEIQLYEKFKGHKIGVYNEAMIPNVYVMDLEIMKHIYIKDFDHFVNRRSFDNPHEPHMNLSLFNLDGQPWRQIRSKTSPAFASGKIKRMFSTFESSSQKLITALQAQVNKNNSGMELEVRPLLQKFTMDVIATVAFGIKSNMFEEKDTEFTKMSKKMTNLFAGLNALKFIVYSFSPKLAKILRIKFLDDDTDKFFSSVVVQCLQQRMATGEKREDFLQLMLEARNEKNKMEGDDKGQIELTDDVIIAQCLGFILGGYDTLETLVTWLLYVLACNPQVQDQLYAELKALKDDDDNSQLTYDGIMAADYLDRVLSETLRMYPPGFRTERKSNLEYKIPGMDATLPKETVVVLPIYPVHHDPQYWPNPSEFDPDRFTKENVAKRHPCAYLPFGLGPRMCIAQRFSLVEAKVVLAHLVTNFEFAPCQKTIIPPVFVNDLTLKYSDNLWLNITPR